MTCSVYTMGLCMFSGLIIYFWIPGEIEGEKLAPERFQKALGFVKNARDLCVI